VSEKVGILTAADPMQWRRVKSGPNAGDYEQQDGRYRLAAMSNSSGRTVSWVLYIDGDPHEQRSTLRQAKTYALKLTTAPAATDEQIIALGEDPSSSLKIRALCIAAMRIVYGDSVRQLRERARARARCAEIINARRDLRPPPSDA